MDIRTAADICHAPFSKRAFRDQTLDLAEQLVGEENLRNAEREAQANVDAAFRAASYTLETAAINLRAYTRGMVSKQTLPSYIKQAREALDAMESAL